MSVQIIAANGCFVTAEQGGGIDTRNPATPVALRARAKEANAWEQFQIIKLKNGYVIIVTVNGFLVTAEMDGGFTLSTRVKFVDENSAGPWEMFKLIDNGLLAHNGKNWVCCEAGSTDPILICDRIAQAAWETFQFIGLKPPIPSDITLIKGNYCQYLPAPINLPYPAGEDAPTNLFFSPGYVTYDYETRKQIRQIYRYQQGYTHMPLNLTNHSSIYRNYYPDWDDNNINTYLVELLSDGIIPIGFVMGDHDTVVDCKADPDLVPIAVAKWEDTKPLTKPELDSTNTFHLVKQKYPKSIIYWHNPPYQGAPFVEYSDWGLPMDDPGINAKVWNFMVHQCGVQGLLAQCKAWEHNAQDSINSLHDFGQRLVHGLNGWPICEYHDFEETAYYLFNMRGVQKQADAWVQKIRANSPDLKGYCNG
jgi:hypothetical protein